ncbi:hypothetical protein OC834_007929, partial [Tilletia horrida]
TKASLLAKTESGQRGTKDGVPVHACRCVNCSAGPKDTPQFRFVHGRRYCNRCSLRIQRAAAKAAKADAAAAAAMQKKDLPAPHKRAKDRAVRKGMIDGGSGADGAGLVNPGGSGSTSTRKGISRLSRRAQEAITAGRHEQDQGSSSSSSEKGSSQRVKAGTGPRSVKVHDTGLIPIARTRLIPIARIGSGSGSGSGSGRHRHRHSASASASALALSGKMVEVVPPPLPPNWTGGGA